MPRPSVSYRNARRFPKSLTALEVLKFYARLRNIRGERVDWMLEAWCNGSG
jgi:ABC-type multidrug transport system ATPase subunit